LAAAVVPSTQVFAQSWPQWAFDAQHTGQVGVAGQPMNSILARIVYDPLVPAEMAANGNQLVALYQVPLIDAASNVYMEFKSGTYNKNRYSTEIWREGIPMAERAIGAGLEFHQRLDGSGLAGGLSGAGLSRRTRERVHLCSGRGRHPV